MDRVTKYKKNYHIDLNVVDFKKELKLSSLFGYFQDIANEAAENLGVGINQLVENYGVAFVLMRIRIDLIHVPKLDEEITIETWPLKPGKLEFERDFIVYNQNGEVIARAVSVWVIMDLKKRRLKRSEAINLEYPELITEKAIEVELAKIKASENPETVYHKTIGYSDIDFNAVFVKIVVAFLFFSVLNHIKSHYRASLGGLLIKEQNSFCSLMRRERVIRALSR